MSINFKSIQRVNPRDIALPKKYYAQIVSGGYADINELSALIGEISTVSTIDTKAVLNALSIVMAKEISQGKIIRLGEFGTFSVTISSEGVENEADVRANIIKGNRLHFRPGPEMKNALGVVKYKKVATAASSGVETGN